MRQIRWWVVFAGGLLCCLALIWWVVRVTLLAPGARGEASGYGQFVLAAVGLLIVVAGAMSKSVRARTPEQPRLDLLSETLAMAVRNQWERAAVERRLLEPAALPVRWRRSPIAVSGPLAAATAARDARFDPLPVLTRVTSARLRLGTRRSLHAIYGGLASGRLVIVGAPGSGKSATAILLLLDALRFREQAAPDDRPRIPVPVMFTVHGWNPEAVPLREWLTSKLAELSLFYGRAGAHRAGQLLDAGRVAVFLDGLDEITDSVRPLVLRALSEQATFRLVLLSRSAELVTAARAAHLVGSVAVELLPIRSAEAAEYLLRQQVSPAPAPWQAIADELASGRTGPLICALTNPLTVTLLRDAYPPTGPVDELLDTTRFRTADDIENHLLDHVLIAAYRPRPGQRRPPYSLDSARRTLRYIAVRLNKEGTRDLAWWRIRNWVPEEALRLPCVLGLGFGAMLAAAYGKDGIDPSDALLWALVGALVGTMVGLGGSSSEGDPRRIMPVRFRAPAARENMTVLLAQSFGLVIVLSVLFALVGLHFGAMSNGKFFGTFPTWVGFGLVGVLVSGLALGTAFYQGLLLPWPDDDGGPCGPVHLWRQNWAFGLVSGFGLGLLAIVFLGPVLWLASDLGVPMGLRAVVTITACGGLVIGITFALAATVGWVLVLTQIHLAFRRRTPWRLLRFLEDARSRHVLRTVGPIYQFRHAKLQDRLALE